MWGGNILNQTKMATLLGLRGQVLWKALEDVVNNRIRFLIKYIHVLVGGTSVAC